MPVKIAFRSAFASLLSVLFLALVFVADSRAGDRSGIVELEFLTSPEVSERLRAGTATIIIPTGGTEQNGPHMALGKHNLIVRETTRRIALELKDALVAPVIGYVPQGAPDTKWGHMAFPGTISLPEDVFGAVLENAALSFKTHGFKRIVFLGDSGGNQRTQQRIADKLADAWRAEGVSVLAAGNYYAANGGDEFLKSHGLSASQIGTHAGVRDTSELMAVAPDAVDLAKAAAGAAGTSGDATLSRAEWGEQLIARKVASAVAEIRKLPAVASGSPRTVNTGMLGWLFGLFAG